MKVSTAWAGGGEGQSGRSGEEEWGRVEGMGRRDGRGCNDQEKIKGDEESVRGDEVKSDEVKVRVMK